MKFELKHNNFIQENMTMKMSSANASHFVLASVSNLTLFLPPEKVYLEEESPVYVSKEGDVVTDLAYQTSLSQLAGQNPFDSPDGGGVEVSGFGVDFGDGFGSPGDDFMGAGKLGLDSDLTHWPLGDWNGNLGE